MRGTAVLLMRSARFVARGNGQAPAARHGIARVDGEIGDDLLDLAEVGTNPGFPSLVMKGTTPRLNRGGEEA